MISRSFGIAILLFAVAGGGFAQDTPEQACCKDKQRGRQNQEGPHGQQGRRGMMMGGDGDHAKDMELFHFLLDHRDQIQRSVKELPDGIETVTESDNPEVAAKIREHVASMYTRIEEVRPIHRRDPLFDEIFKHTEAIEMKMEKTDKGLFVRETSSDPYVAKLIKAHAEVVSKFIENGYSEMRKNHPIPEKTPSR